MKDSAVREGGGYPVRTFCRQKEGRDSSDADVRTFWCKKQTFRYLWCVHADKGERVWATADIFRTRGGWECIFLRFCVDVFYGWPLSSYNIGSK